MYTNFKLDSNQIRKLTNQKIEEEPTEGGSRKSNKKSIGKTRKLKRN